MARDIKKSSLDTMVPRLEKFNLTYPNKTIRVCLHIIMVMGRADSLMLLVKQFYRAIELALN